MILRTGKAHMLALVNITTLLMKRLKVMENIACVNTNLWLMHKLMKKGVNNAVCMNFLRDSCCSLSCNDYLRGDA